MAAEALIGRQVDHYLIEQYIGCGEMSDVYLATDVYLGRQVALKILHSDFAHDKNILARFQQDAETVARLNHPNILRIYTMGVTADERPYLAMQYTRGGSLQDQLASPPATAPTPMAAMPMATMPTRQGFTVLRALTIVREIALALHGAHQAGIIHGRLKPSHILLHPDGTPVLAGLGMAAVWQETAQLEKIGTIPRASYYASPEQINGNALDQRSDIYSLGVILYELLTEQPPFQDATQPVLLPQSDEAPTMPLNPPGHARPNLTAATYAVIDGCLQQSPEFRFQSALQLVEAIDQALIEEGYDVPDAPKADAPAHPAAHPAVRSVARPAMRPAVRPTADRKRLGWPIIGLIAILLTLLGLVAFNMLNTTDALSEPTPDSIPPTTEGPISSPLPGGQDATPAADDDVLPLLPTPTLITSSADAPTPSLPPPAITLFPSSTTEPGIVTADVTAVQLATPPVIDGRLDEWAAVTPILSAYQVYQDPAWDETDDLTVTWRLGWDSQYLYFAVSVLDDIHAQSQTDSQIFRGDSVEVQLDTNRTEDFAPELKADDFQLTFSPGGFNTLPPSAYLWQGEANEFAGVAADGIVIEATQTGEGYDLEAAVPWSDLGISDPAVGLIIGVALNATDNDQPGEALQEVFKSHVETRLFANPTSWGTLTLE